MKQNTGQPQPTFAQQPQDPKDSPLHSQTGPTPNRDEVRKIAPPIHAPRQSLRPKKQRTK